MTDRRKSSTGLWTTMAVIAVVVSPFMYMAFLGPLYFLVANGNIDGMTWDMAALPVESFREQIDDFPDWFWGTYQAYLEWWFFLPLDPA